MKNTSLLCGETQSNVFVWLQPDSRWWMHALDTNFCFQLNDVDAILADSNSMDNMNIMMIDEDYMGLMSDTLFSTITNQPFAFPDTRELGKMIIYITTTTCKTYTLFCS